MILYKVPICNLGHKVFNNFMRQQIKDVDLEKNEVKEKVNKEK